VNLTQKDTGEWTRQPIILGAGMVLIFLKLKVRSTDEFSQNISGGNLQTFAQLSGDKAKLI
jgi:hypothetical protein